MSARNLWILTVVCLAMSALIMTGCGSSTGGVGGGTGAINCGGCGSSGGGGGTSGAGSGTSSSVSVTFLSNPNCGVSSGANHLYLTVSDVQVNPDKLATAASSGWVDMTPTLASSPKQLDLFNLSLTAGNLATSSVLTGTYGSINLKLGGNSASVTSNQCTSVSTTNCLVSNGVTRPIYVAEEATNGIVINQDEMLSSGIVIGGSGTNVNLLFNSCSSLLDYQGGFRLVPKTTAWTGAFQLYNVQVSDAVTGAAVPFAQVSLQTVDSTNVQDVISEGVSNGAGAVSLPGPTGTFDVVAAAVGGSSGSTVYGPLAITGVAGTGTGTAVTARLQPALGTSAGGVNINVQSNTTIDLRFRALQAGTINGLATKNFVIPFLDAHGVMAASTTSPSVNCGTTPCVSATYAVPAEPLYVQPFNGTVAQSSTGPLFSIEAEAFRSQLAGVRNCTITALSTPAVAVTPGSAVTMPTMTFTGCL